MSNHYLPDCQECGNETATSFDPDGSMLCQGCRAAADELQATEAGDPTVWIMQGDNGELVDISPAMIIPAPDAPVVSLPILSPSVPATWVVTPDGEVSRNPAWAVSEEALVDRPSLYDLLVSSLNAPQLDMSVFYGTVPQPVDVVDAEVVEVVDTIEPAAADTRDVVNHPSHYTSHPSGVECITITEHMGFNLGNAVKYIWRCDLKWDAIEDLKKARFYIDREIARRERQIAARTKQG